MIYNYRDFRETIINLSLPRVFEEEEIIRLYKLYTTTPPSSLNTQEYTQFKQQNAQLYNILRQYGEEYAIRFFELYKLYNLNMALILFPVFLLNKIDTNLNEVYALMTPELKHKMNTNIHYDNVLRLSINTLATLATKVKEMPLLSIYHTSFPYSILGLLMEGGQAFISDENDWVLNEKLRKALTHLFLLLKFKATKTSLKTLFKLIDIKMELEEMVVDLEIHKTTHFQEDLTTNLFTLASDPRKIEFYFRPYNPKTDTKTLTLNPIQTQTIINRIINTLIMTNELSNSDVKTLQGLNKISKTASKMIGAKIIKTNIMLITFIDKKLKSEDINAILKIVEKFAPYYIYSQLIFIYIDYTSDEVGDEDFEEDDATRIHASYPIEFSVSSPDITTENYTTLSNTIITHLYETEIPRLVTGNEINYPMYRLNEYFKDIFWIESEIEVYQ